MGDWKEVSGKLRQIFKSPAIRTIAGWSGCIRGMLAGICLLTSVATVSSLMITLATRGMIDGATSGDSSALWRYGLALAALVAAERVMSVFNSLLRTKASAKLQKHMQGMITESLLDKEYGAISRFHSGELVNRIFSDARVVNNGVMTIIPSFLQTMISFIGAAVILITMDWRFIPVLIAGGLLGSVLIAAFREPVKRRHRKMQEAEDALHAVTQETVENLRIVKASLSGKRAAAQMNENRERLCEEQLRSGRLSILMNQGLGSLFDLSWLLCNLWGCVKIYHGTFTYGNLAAMIQLVGRIQSPIANAVYLVSQVYGVVASAERLMEVVGLPEEEAGEPADSFDEIRLEDVSFQYDSGAGDRGEDSRSARRAAQDEVLVHLNEVIRRGDFVALTGASGGGKTSLFQLLLGIYRPTGGQISFADGEKRVRASRATRKLFAYVPQGNLLLSGTLRDNLTMFTDSATEEQIGEAVRAACIGDMVAEIGLDAVLGEHGTGLSEGQAQRVAVARALLSDAPILLLDEATSALDEETEARLLENISAMRNKTCMIVTHRRAALSICDYILHIENGRMIRKDTHGSV